MMDLAEVHAPIGALFLDGGSDCELTTAEVNSFHQNGYLAGISVLTGEQVEALRIEAQRLSRPDYAADRRFYEFNVNESTDISTRLFHALGAWRVGQSFHDLVFFRPIVRLAEQLLGGRVRLWHDQIFIKPARDGGIVAWHQDYSYWTRTTPVAHLTCWIALDDSIVENGCLHYVPGSHRWDLLPRGDLAADMNAILSLLDDEQRRQFTPVPVPLRAGQVSFHHPMLVHGSFENRSDRPRCGAVINFISDGVISDSDQPLLAGIPPVPRGEKLQGRYFPLL